MLSGRNPLWPLVRRRLFSTPHLRCQPKTHLLSRQYKPPNTISTRKRYLSSDNKNDDAALEDFARSLTRALGNNQSAEVSLEPAMELARKLSPEARTEILRVASSSSNGSAVEASAAAVQEVDVPEPSYRDLRLVALAQAIPFLGFGFMDNAILIIAGDAIDTSLGRRATWMTSCGNLYPYSDFKAFAIFEGVVLGISTLCAAAIGEYF